MSIKETIEKLKELQRTQAQKLIGMEVLGFKIREYSHSSRGNKYKSFYAVKSGKGTKVQIYLGIPESLEEVENKIKAFVLENEAKK